MAMHQQILMGQVTHSKIQQSMVMLPLMVVQEKLMIQTILIIVVMMVVLVVMEVHYLLRALLLLGIYLPKEGLAEILIPT